MSHEQQQQSYRSRRWREQNPRRPPSDLDSLRHHLPPVDRAHNQGIFRSSKRTFVPTKAVDSSCGTDLRHLPIEEKSFSFEFRQSSSKKASGTPIKTVIVEEMPKEMENRRPSPGIIARLMGIDTVPSSHVVPKQNKGMASFQKRSTMEFQDNYAAYEDHSHNMSFHDHQEFRDVFEVIEMSKADKHTNQRFRKGISNLIRDDTDKPSAKQNFLDVKRLLTDETFPSYNDIGNAKEAIDYDEDIFLSFLQEPNSLFAKHIYDLNCAPRPRHASDITILKSSKRTKSGAIEIYRSSGRNAERYPHIHRDTIGSRTKSVASCGCHSFKGRKCYLPDTFSETQNDRKTDAYHDPSNIVILKPSLQKAHNMATTVTSLRFHEKYQFGFRKSSGKIGSHELHSRRKDLQQLSTEDVIGYKTKNPIDTSRKSAKEVRHNENRNAKKALPSKFNGYSSDESSCAESGLGSLNDAQVVRWTGRFDYGNSFDASSSISKASVNKVPRKQLSASSSYLTESSMNREARRRLSTRWKMSHQLQQAGLVSKQSSTLCEMLAVSENETPKTTGLLITQGVPNKEVVKDETLATRYCDFGSSSKDGWRDRCSADLLNSISYQATSADYANPEASIGNSSSGMDFYVLKDVQDAGYKESLNGKFCPLENCSVRSFKFKNGNLQLFYDGETCMLPQREIDVRSEEPSSEIPADYLADEKPAVSGLSKYTSCHTTKKELAVRPIREGMLDKDGEITYYNQKKIAIKETSNEHPQVGSLIYYCKLSEVGSPISSNGTDQPSPVSVLEPPSEEDKSDLRCFEKISANLQELRMQLQHLKFDSCNVDAKEFDLISSDQETETSDRHPQMLQEFKGEEDRDFSYILDVVIESGVHGPSWISLFDTCYSDEYPVGADVFDKLEKKYSSLVSWSKTERKQLFDLINATLVESILPQTNLRPWVKPRRIFGTMLGHEDFIEALWQMVVDQRKGPSNSSVEKLLELRWLDLRRDVDMIGMEIERMLGVDLLEELALELLLKEDTLQLRW